MPKMIVSIDGVVIKEVSLVKDRTTLGRRPYNDIVIDNLAISGEHAVLHMIDGSVYLEDLNSTNGTYVNARAVRRHMLEHNDVVEVGKYKIRFLAGHQPFVASRPMTAPAPLQAVAPVPLAPASSSGVRASAPLGGGVAPAAIRVLSGAGAGRELTLAKVVTTIGRPGVAVAAVTRRLHGYVVAPIDGGTLLNGEQLGQEAVALQDGDVLELGGTKMQFVRV
ncbi:MAG: FHA domain-containing protein [Variovorax sp.]|jgi:predicted component of type VI protein secretion system|nr:MAG: FHA domain-containing protein [Variovorax sp.]